MKKAFIDTKATTRTEAASEAMRYSCYWHEHRAEDTEPEHRTSRAAYEAARDELTEAMNEAAADAAAEREHQRRENTEHRTFEIDIVPLDEIGKLNHAEAKRAEIVQNICAADAAERAKAAAPDGYRVFAYPYISSANDADGMQALAAAAYRAYKKWEIRNNFSSAAALERTAEQNEEMQDIALLAIVESYTAAPDAAMHTHRTAAFGALDKWKKSVYQISTNEMQLNDAIVSDKLKPRRTDAAIMPLVKAISSAAADALAECTDKQQSVFINYYYYGMSIIDITKNIYNTEAEPTTGQRNNIYKMLHLVEYAILRKLAENGDTELLDIANITAADAAAAMDKLAKRCRRAAADTAAYEAADAAAAADAMRGIYRRWPDAAAVRDAFTRRAEAERAERAEAERAEAERAERAASKGRRAEFIKAEKIVMPIEYDTPIRAAADAIENYRYVKYWQERDYFTSAVKMAAETAEAERRAWSAKMAL